MHCLYFGIFFFVFHSEEKLKCIVGEQVVYEVAPIMRPIVFLGPSIKSSKVNLFC